MWLLDEAILHAFFLYLSQNSFYGYTFFYTDELSGLIADKMKNHPYYTQQLSQQVWFRTPDSGCTQKNVEETFNSLIDQLSLLFANIIDTLTSKQINFLLAVADGVVKRIPLLGRVKVDSFLQTFAHDGHEVR